MKIGILGSGIVAQTLATKLIEVGNDVMISSRDINKEKDMGWMKVQSPISWKEKNSTKAHVGSFIDAAKFGEVLFNCTSGGSSLSVISSVKEHIDNKILIDVANSLDFSKGMPPTLSICNTTSLGEQIQEKFPDIKVVKTLNTIGADLMVNPSLIPGDHVLFVSANDSEAKEWVTETLLKKWFNWKSIIDLGDITTARGTEMYLPLWLRMFGKFENPHFNINIVRGN